MSDHEDGQADIENQFINDTINRFATLQEKQDKINTIFEFFIQDEYREIYEYLVRNKKNTGHMTQAHMCLNGMKGNRSLEFYRDAYMINSFGINIPVEKLDVFDLGI